LKSPRRLLLLTGFGMKIQTSPLSFVPSRFWEAIQHNSLSIAKYELSFPIKYYICNKKKLRNVLFPCTILQVFNETFCLALLSSLFAWLDPLPIYAFPSLMVPNSSMNQFVSSGDFGHSVT